MQSQKYRANEAFMVAVRSRKHFNSCYLKENADGYIGGADPFQLTTNLKLSGL